MEFYKKAWLESGCVSFFAIYSYTELKPNVPLPAQEEVSFARCVDGDTARLMIDRERGSCSLSSRRYTGNGKTRDTGTTIW